MSCQGAEQDLGPSPRAPYPSVHPEGVHVSRGKGSR
jgi:hypothetical protein